MTVTDQPITTDLPCVCGCPKWDHKQGRAVCKQCGCERYEPSSALVELRAEVEQLHQAVTVIAAERDEAVFRASQAANEAASLRLRCEHLEREEVHARGLVDEAREQRNKAQAALRDVEAALVEANDARRMRASEVLHRDLTRAALTLAPPELAYACLRCGCRFDFDDVDHRCGPMVPVDVIIARRPNPPTTEEQP